MSVDVFVFLRSDRTLTTAAWQSLLDELETGVLLDDTCDVNTHSGFWPAVVHGKDAGFEFYLTAAEEVVADLGVDVGNCDLVAQFVTHSDLVALKSSMLAAAALARLGDGVVFDEDTGGTTSYEVLLEQGRAVAE